MSFPKYSAYKESGLKWIGAIPAHWSLAPYKHFVDIQNGADHKQVESAEGYLLRVFNAMKAYLEAVTFGATIKTVGMADVKKLVTPVPPMVEQQAIAQFVEGQKASLDGLVKLAEDAISLLGERRNALISAAVTGKIDVRAWADAKAAA